ncbi:hypothetical protein [Borrelia miyamotoi]|uniref:Uncharacterized protein n=1 Tax=Borrelia miyamotoi TaxID=47466 RepID=A0AAQ2WVU5_9SPIR|nr:hypothetical protein [Borrelia miyamotoi]AOW95972.1 hypothetical protein AXH25_03935 [Borrelia miyamotoi]QTL83866.1 hypothetical protein bmLB2001_000786 [Borrelia miyamotoi]WAZ84828.1 hypothetical protein O5400_00285 [Borrelia miyamotoi]WAZ90610.1 hypothetical protein O5398_00285 [Borrelia miyamotoi]WAZ91893.1 hypothetical protein O5402_00285 [Borrelia miyamotoi]
MGNSDSLYRVSLRDNILLLDRIYFLRFAIDIGSFIFVKLRGGVYYRYFSLILSQNDDINKMEKLLIFMRNWRMTFRMIKV